MSMQNMEIFEGLRLRHEKLQRELEINETDIIDSEDTDVTKTLLEKHSTLSIQLYTTEGMLQSYMAAGQEAQK